MYAGQDSQSRYVALSALTQLLFYPGTLLLYLIPFPSLQRKAGAVSFKLYVTEHHCVVRQTPDLRLAPRRHMAHRSKNESSPSSTCITSDPFTTGTYRPLFCRDQRIGKHKGIIECSKSHGMGSTVQKCSEGICNNTHRQWAEATINNPKTNESVT